MQDDIQLLITGDAGVAARYVGFAKAKVNALRELGLLHLSKTFIIDDVTIRIKLNPVGDKVFIDVAGCPVTADGFVDAVAGTEGIGWMSRALAFEQKDWNGDGEPDLPGKFYGYFPKTPPANPLIINPANPDLQYCTRFPPILTSVAERQFYLKKYPQLFTGKMRELAQATLGTGLCTSDTMFPFDHRWGNCHGLFTASDGSHWAIEILGAVINRVPVTICQKGADKPPIFVSWDESKRVQIGEAVVIGTPLFGGWAFNYSGNEFQHVMWTTHQDQYAYTQLYTGSVSEGTLEDGTVAPVSATVSGGGEQGPIWGPHSIYGLDDIGYVHAPSVSGYPGDTIYDISVVTKNIIYPILSPFEEGEDKTAPVYVFYNGDIAKVVYFHFTASTYVEGTVAYPDVVDDGMMITPQARPSNYFYGDTIDARMLAVTFYVDADDASNVPQHIDDGTFVSQKNETGETYPISGDSPYVWSYGVRRGALVGPSTVPPYDPTPTENYFSGSTSPEVNPAVPRFPLTVNTTAHGTQDSGYDTAIMSCVVPHYDREAIVLFKRRLFKDPSHALTKNDWYGVRISGKPKFRHGTTSDLGRSEDEYMFHSAINWDNTSMWYLHPDLDAPLGAKYFGGYPAFDQYADWPFGPDRTYPLAGGSSTSITTTFDPLVPNPSPPSSCNGHVLFYTTAPVRNVSIASASYADNNFQSEQVEMTYRVLSNHDIGGGVIYRDLPGIINAFYVHSIYLYPFVFAHASAVFEPEKYYMQSVNPNGAVHAYLNGVEYPLVNGAMRGFIGWV